MNFLVGAVIGVGVQAAIDVWRGQRSSLGTYLGAAAGGALTGGASALIRGVGTAAFVGAAGAITSNLTQQTVDIGTGTQEQFSGTSLAAQTALGGAFGAAGTKIVPWIKSNLTNIEKGWIGDAISAGYGLMRGKIPIGYQTRIKGFPDLTTIADWKFFNTLTMSIEYVEAKFGGGSLTGPQTTALNTLENYFLEEWSYKWLRGAVPAGTGIVGSDIGAALK